MLNMRIAGLLAFSLLAVVILSNSVVVGYSQSDSNDLDPRKQVLPTAEFNLKSTERLYANGQTVTMTGAIPNYADQTMQQPILVKILYLAESGDNVSVRLLGIKQVSTSSDGSFTFSFNAGGPLWKENGDYYIIAHHGSNRDVATIEFTGANENLFAGVNQVEPEPEPVTPDPVPIAPEVTPEPEVIPPPPPPPPVDTTPPPPPPPPEPEPEPEPEPPVCGTGTMLVNGTCQIIPDPEPPADDNNGGGGCLIATAAYGTELAPQVQFLREMRDSTLMSTASGSSFMTGFNQVYYTFSPAIADMERDNPAFRDAVLVAITPMISTLSIMSLADPGSEADVLGLGISVIALNLAMYIAAPALVGFGAYRLIKSKKIKF